MMGLPRRILDRWLTNLHFNKRMQGTIRLHQRKEKIYFVCGVSSETREWRQGVAMKQHFSFQEGVVSPQQDRNLRYDRCPRPFSCQGFGILLRPCPAICAKRSSRKRFHESPISGRVLDYDVKSFDDESMPWNRGRRNFLAVSAFGDKLVWVHPSLL